MTRNVKLNSSDIPSSIVIYARVSTDDQANNGSLPSQVAECRKMASRLWDIMVASDCVYQDEESGMRIDRPELNKLREYLRKHQNVALIINTSDRLSRRPGHAEELFDEFRDHGVRLFIVLHGRELRLDNPYDRQMLLMEMGFNRTWHFMLREALVRGNNEALERGSIAVGGARKYGYVKIKTEKKITLEINSDEARILRNIFEWLVYDRLTTADIKRRLHGTATPGDSIGFNNDKGWRKRAYGDWNLATIYRLLRDRAYTGKYEVYQADNIYRATSFDIPPIIPIELFEQAQEILDAGKKRSRRNANTTESVFLMARRVECACGTAVHASWADTVGNRADKTSRRYYYYRCGTYANAQHSTKDKCGLPYFKQDVVDDAVWKWLVEKCRNPKGFAAILEESQKNDGKEHTRLYDRLEQIKETRARILGEIETLLTSQPKNATPAIKALFERKLEEANRVDAELSEEESRISAQLDSIHVSSSFIDKWNQTAQEITPDLPLDRKRYYIDRLGITLTLAYEDGKRMVYVHVKTHTEAIELDVSVTDSSSATAG